MCDNLYQILTHLQLHCLHLIGIILVLLLDLQTEGHKVIHSLILKNGGCLENRSLFDLRAVVENLKDDGPCLMILGEFD